MDVSPWAEQGARRGVVACLCSSSEKQWLAVMQWGVSTGSSVPWEASIAPRGAGGLREGKRRGSAWPWSRGAALEVAEAFWVRPAQSAVCVRHRGHRSVSEQDRPAVEEHSFSQTKLIGPVRHSRQAALPCPSALGGLKTGHAM